MKGTELSHYQICLLMWFYGLTGEEVRNSDWEEANLGRAERYAEQKDADVEEWERLMYHTTFEEYLDEYVEDLDLWNMSDADYRKIKQKARDTYHRITGK